MPNPLIFLKGLTWQGKAIVGLALALLLVGTHWLAYSRGHTNGVNAEKAAQAALHAKVIQIGNEAGDAAHGAVVASQGRTEAENKEARDAAAESDDPLRAAMDWLNGGGR